jgi:type IV pilus assembly protein PilM
MPKKSKLSIGLDLGSSYIKAVKIEHTNNHYLIKDFILKKIDSSSNLPILIKDTLEKINSQKVPVNISLSGQNVVCRYVTIPLLAEDEFKNALKFEITKYIPFSPQDIYFDGCILKKDTQQNKMLVLMVAAKKDYLNQHISLIKDVGFTVNLVHVDSLVLSDCFNFNFSKQPELTNKTVALLNIGSSFSNLNIMEESLTVLSRDIRIAGNDITLKISTDLSCSFEEAEKIKIQASTDENKLQSIKPSLENVLSLLAQELRISFDYYETQSISTVEKLYLCGGQLLIKDVADILTHLLGIETLVFNPLENFEFDKNLNVTEIKQASLQLAVALGLGLR